MTSTINLLPEDPEDPTKPKKSKPQGPKGFIEWIFAGGIIGCMMVITIFMLFVGAFVNAYVLVCLWEWFIVTTFSTAPLSLPQAFGISLFYSYLSYRGRSSHSKDALSVVVRPKEDRTQKDYELEEVYHLKSKMDMWKYGQLWKFVFSLVIFPAITLGLGKFVHFYWIIQQ